MAQETPKAKASRLAERKRVDESYAKGIRERAASRKPVAKTKSAPAKKDPAKQTGVERMVSFFRGDNW